MPLKHIKRLGAKLFGGGNAPPGPTEPPRKESTSRPAPAFGNLGLPAELLRAVEDLGFSEPTPIQRQAIPPIIAGRNVTGRAQTGTGKTAAYLLGIFTRFLQDPPPANRRAAQPRALVLAPTRELVLQVVKDAEKLGAYCDFNCLAVFGGTDLDRQRRRLHGDPLDLVAATPGRLLDFQRRRDIDLGRVEVLVIDEADRMLDMGFIPDVRKIIRSTPPKNRRQTLLFSATLSEEVTRLASRWMPEPTVVEVEPEQVAVETVEPIVYTVPSRDKFKLLYNLLQDPALERVLVFTNRRDRAQRVADSLHRYGVACEILSGAVPQNKRIRVLEGFREGRIRVVVATDVAGRGLHVDNISHVINFDFPYEAEDYVHRIGRTGRAGHMGTAISFACEDESFIIPEIEAYIGEPIACSQPDDALLAELPPPSAPPRKRPRDSRDRRSRNRSGSRTGRSPSASGRRPPRRGGRRPGGR